MSSQSGDAGIQKPAAPEKYKNEKSMIPEPVKIVVIIVLVLAVVFLFYNSRQNRNEIQAELERISEQIQALENSSKLAEASLSGQITGLKEEVAGTQTSVATTKTELRKTIQADRQKTKEELNQAIAATAEVEAKVLEAKSDADTKITEVNTEVGGVKSDVVQVKTDLEDTKRKLEVAQQQLASVGENLEAAIAKNATELAQLRLKGERDYYEFEFPKKKKIVKVEDVRFILTKTDKKKGKFNMKILVDDGEIERKDLLINEPIQFLVGPKRVRYEVVINWVDKDKAGGYLAVPKDKTLAAIGTPVSQ